MGQRWCSGTEYSDEYEVRAYSDFFFGARTRKIHFRRCSFCMQLLANTAAGNYYSKTRNASGTRTPPRQSNNAGGGTRVKEREAGTREAAAQGGFWGHRAVPAPAPARSGQGAWHLTHVAQARLPQAGPHQVAVQTCRAQLQWPAGRRG